jgi:hypothetical protein
VIDPRTIYVDIATAASRFQSFFTRILDLCPENEIVQNEFSAFDFFISWLYDAGAC